MTCALPARVRHFGGADSGQIAFITLFGAVALVGLLGLVMTTGDQAAAKIEAQNAADAAALSGGSWIARGLNLTSAINIIQTQLVGGAIALDAFDRTLTIAGKWVPRECIAYTACAKVFPILCLIPKWITCGERAILPEVLDFVHKANEKLAACPDGFFWFAAKGLQWLNTAVHISFYAIAFAEAFSVAEGNGTEGAAFLPGPLFHGSIGPADLTLPTKEAQFPALCDPMENGSPSKEVRGYTKHLGYPVGQGPLALGKCRLSYASLFLTGFPPFGPVVLPLIANQRREALCKGSASAVDAAFPRPAEDLEECRRLDGKARWRFMTVEIQPVEAENGCRWLGDRIEGKAPPYADVANLDVVQDSEREQPCSTPPQGELIASATYCESNMREPHTEFSPTRYFHSLKVQVLEQATVSEGTVLEAISSGSCDSVKPHPYLLSDEEDALKFLVVARRPNRRVFFSDKFLETPPTLYTYSQVEVYSGISSDTFNQDWRVRLERAYLLEKPFERLGKGVSGFLDELTRFGDMLPVILPHQGLSWITDGLLRQLFSRATESDYSAEGDNRDSTFRRVLNH